MRILTTALLLTICAVPPAAAQGIEKGVRAGASFAKTADSGGAGNGSGLDWQLRPVFGGFVTWRVARWLELQPELLYAMKGAKSDEFVETSLLLDYLEVPVLARVTRGAPGGTRFYIAAGPSLGLLLRARTRADFGASTEEIDIKDDLESADLGVVIGGGIEFGSIVIDGRYTHGLTAIEKDAADGQQSKNRAVSATVGIKF